VSDPISPSVIEHRLEAASHEETGELLFRYNYLYYQFDVTAGRIWARSYLDDIKRASLFLPADVRIDHPDAKNVMGYLALRFERIDMLGEAGYVNVWPTAGSS
jgi:hypothetical protein